MGTLEGVAAIRGFYEDWIGSYEEYRAEIDGFVDFGNGITLAVLNLTVHMTNYTDIDEARAAAERLAQEGGR